MLRFLRLLTQGEAQRDAYAWASVAMAHAALPLIGWPILALWLGPWAATAVLSAIYAGWEAWQWRPGLTWDCVLDWTAWTCGCLALTYIATGALLSASAVGVAVVIILAAGVIVRD